MNSERNRCRNGESIRCLNSERNILNKSENATPELFAIYIQNYANQECN